jgi:hypothetical protein
VELALLLATALLLDSDFFGAGVGFSGAGVIGVGALSLVAGLSIADGLSTVGDFSGAGGAIGALETGGVGGATGAGVGVISGLPSAVVFGVG